MRGLISIILFLLISCNQSNVKTIPYDKYYVHMRNDISDTSFTSIFDKPDSTFHIVRSKKIDSHFGSFELFKFTNEPSAPTDGGIELFYEPKIGIFFSRSLTWPEYTRIYYIKDSINGIISMLIDRILSDPDFCNYPLFDTSKINIKKFVVPKIN